MPRTKMTTAAAVAVLIMGAACTGDPSEPTGTIEPPTTEVPGTRATQPDGSPLIGEGENGLQGTPGAEP